jgi:hypothetical protein
MMKRRIIVLSGVAVLQSPATIAAMGAGEVRFSKKKRRWNYP